MIEFKDYKKLKKNLFSIYNEFIDYKIIQFSPWLNLVKAHPHLLTEYDDIFKKTHKKNIINSKSLFEILKKMIIFFKEILTSSNFYPISINHKNIDVMFISTLISEENFYSEDDFYFNNIPKEIGKKLNVLLILRNIAKVNPQKIKILSNKFNYNKLLLPLRCGFYYEIFFILLMIYTKFKLKQYNYKDSFKEKIYKNLISYNVLSKSIRNIRLFYQIKKLIYLYRPKYIVSTFEGHIWERSIFCIAKKIDPKIKIIGYQYSIFTKHQNSFFINYKSKFNPSMILTSSIYGEELLKKHYNNINIAVHTIGNNKNLDNFNFFLSDRFNTCLVIPEGIDSEIEILFNFTKKCSHLFSNINFIFKLHPLVDYDLFYDKNKSTFLSQTNLVLSNKSIDDDISKSNYFIYRGSSLSVKLSYMGLLPIYLDIGDDIDINPLFQINQYIKVIKDPLHFRDIINSNYKNEEILSFAKKYYKPLDVEKLTSIFKKSMIGN